MVRVILPTMVALALLSGCRGRSAEPAPSDEGSAVAEPATTSPDASGAETSVEPPAPTTATTAAAGSGASSMVRTNVPQLRLTTFDGSGAAPNAVMTPDRQLRLQRVAPAQNQLRLRENLQNQVRQPARQGIPSRATTTGATPVRPQPTLVDPPTTTTP